MRHLAEFESTGWAICYIRVSTMEQGRSGLGLKSQRAICSQFAKKLHLELKPDCFDTILTPEPGFFCDPGKSAYTTPFSKRPAGKRALECLKRGDTLIISKLDRGFRNVADFIQVSHDLCERGVRLVIVSPQMDLGTAAGRVLARHIANIAEWESDRKGERIKAALAAKKVRHQKMSDFPKETLHSLPSAWRPETAETIKILKAEQLIAGRIFIYVRCSHRDSAASGLGLLAQLNTAQAWAKDLIVRNPNLELDKVYTDAAVSAIKFELRKRDAGKELDEGLSRGDHVIFASLDRAFRNAKDMFDTFPDWIDRGVEIHFVDEGITMSDPAGRMLAAAIVMFAQMEGEIISERNREARAQLAVQGKYVGGRRPTFWKVFVFCGQKRLIPNRRRIITYIYIRNLIARGVGVTEACRRAEELLAKHEGRRAIPEAGAWKSTTIGKSQPSYIECDGRGIYRAVWDRKMIHSAAPLYEQVMVQWRKMAAERRRIRDLQDNKNQRITRATDNALMLLDDTRITGAEVQRLMNKNA